MIKKFTHNKLYVGVNMNEFWCEKSITIDLLLILVHDCAALTWVCLVFVRVRFNLDNEYGRLMT